MIMNELNHKPKKNSLLHKNHYLPQNNNYLQPYLTLQGGPKNPPNISQYYNQLAQIARPKQGRAKQNKMKHNKDVILLVQKKSVQLTNSHLRIQRERNNSHVSTIPDNPKMSYPKKERKNELKLKRNPKQVKQIHRIVKPHHHLKPKHHNKENKNGPRSTFELKNQYNIHHMTRCGQTETLEYDGVKSNQKYEKSLFCEEINLSRQQIMSKIKKAKIQNQHIGITKSFQLTKGISSHQNIKSIKSLTPEQQIQQFQKQNHDAHSSEQSSALSQLFLRAKNYFQTQNFSCYLQKKQPNLNWFKRAIVINWMIEVSESFGCRRESLAIAVNVLDRYLALSQPINLEDLQKIACGAMCISNKIDGIVFSIKDLCEQTQNITVSQLQKLEIDIGMKLQWKLNPPTSNMWANRISLQWDMYLDHEYENLCLSFKDNINKIKFKTEDTQGYNNYRSLMQYIDLALMDIHSLRYHSREIAASFIYLILTRKLNLYEISEILEQFPLKSDYLLKKSEFNQLYCQFLLESFGFTLRDLLPTVQFCSTFFVLNLCYRLPAIVEKNSEECDITFEELCTYQTCNQSNLIALRKRNRQYD